MKFRQLIEYNMKNIFCEKSFTKCGEETALSPFSKLFSKLSLLYATFNAVEIYWN